MAEPYAISEKWACSLYEVRDVISARLRAIDVVARLI